MKTKISLYSVSDNEIPDFLCKYYNKPFENLKEWEKEYENPIDMTDIIGVFLDNNDKFRINMWVSLDPDIYININDYNGDKIIRYLFERYPY